MFEKLQKQTFNLDYPNPNSLMYSRIEAKPPILRLPRFKEIENLKAQMESMETHIEELSKKIMDQTEPLPEKDLNPDD